MPLSPLVLCWASTGCPRFGSDGPPGSYPGSFRPGKTDKAVVWVGVRSREAQVLRGGVCTPCCSVPVSADGEMLSDSAGQLSGQRAWQERAHAWQQNLHTGLMQRPFFQSSSTSAWPEPRRGGGRSAQEALALTAKVRATHVSLVTWGNSPPSRSGSVDLWNTTRKAAFRPESEENVYVGKRRDSS